MTIKQILACAIPEGKYELALKRMVADIRGYGKDNESFPALKNISDSLCASFEALKDMAEGKYVKKDDVIGMLRPWHKKYNDWHFWQLVKGGADATTDFANAVVAIKDIIEALGVKA